MKKVIEKKKPIETKWVKIDIGRAVSRTNDISVSFSNKKSNGTFSCVVRMGSDILEKMNWVIGDKLDIFHDEYSIYNWMICKAKNGYALHKEQERSAFLKICFTWRKEGVTFHGLRKAEFECKNDQIELTVPV